MNLIRLLPVILSFALLGAHYYRAGMEIVTAFCVLLPLVLLLRRWWVPPLVQALLVLGALEWVRTLYVLATLRSALEQPWVRMAWILGVVAVFTAGSGLVLFNRRLRTRYEE